MIVGVLTTCHTQYTSDSSICDFYLIEQHSKVLLHTLQVLYMWTLCDSTGLFEMIVEVLTTCHTQYTWDRNICIFFILYNKTPSFCYIPYRCSICAPFVILQTSTQQSSSFQTEKLLKPRQSFRITLYIIFLITPEHLH